MEEESVLLEEIVNHYTQGGSGDTWSNIEEE
jgi:hypothetical protein